MGELILCSRMLAALPYYIDEASLNVYSLEELSYYIMHNVYLLEADFMNEELCTWIEREGKQKDMAEQLREILRRDGTLLEFVTCILTGTGYCDREQIKQVTSALAGLMNKSEYECRKIRADRYAACGRYASAIGEYRRLLATEGEKNEILVGNVWHNMGMAYARLFLFPEAADCFFRAYQKNANPESVRECLYAYRCMRDEKGFIKAAELCRLTGEEAAEIGGRLSEISRMESVRKFEEQLTALFAAGDMQTLRAFVEQWLDTYRKNCRI